jgi:ABC-2 type transport system ATP-binding protein
LICGLLPPDEGRVEVGGFDLDVDPIEAKKRVGYVPDGAPLYGNLTPLEHLLLVGRLHGMTDASIQQEGTRLLDEFELGGRHRDPVANFSRGMRQKVAIACALLTRPPLLVLDEPLTGLDTASTQVVRALMREWANRGGAVLVTSHLLEVVEHVCDRLEILSQGRRIAGGTFEELRTQAGHGATLAEVFQALTHARDPQAVAARILGTR